MEVLSLNPGTDIDYRNGEVKLLTLKQKRLTDRKGKHRKHRAPSRIVPVAGNVIAEISNYRVQVSQYIEKGEVSKSEVNPFRLNPATFRKTFYRLAKEAAIPHDLGHPHILRHSYCIELLRAGVPVTVVQDLVDPPRILVPSSKLDFESPPPRSDLSREGRREWVQQ